ncbi:MAG: pyrimidine dimer DNA glycosylase/endonuclease V [Candidatus Woesearchaeota archaeon]
MVRINLIRPGLLSDQHLIAEYAEILMLMEYIRRYPSDDDIPERFCLGKGHMKFFKNKAAYLRKRHERIRKEMRRRGFRTGRAVSFKGMNRRLINDWKPSAKDMVVIKKRIAERIRSKRGFYRYYGEVRSCTFFLNMLKKT